MMENCSMEEIKQKLQAPFEPKDIEWRINRTYKNQNGQGGWVLAYVTARAIQDRLDDVFGPGGWKNEYIEFRDGILCNLSCFINGQWITKSDGAPFTKIESLKGGFSGALKRAGVQWGIGRYLYNLPEMLVEIKPDKIRGANYCDDKKGVKGYWLDPELPTWALPAGVKPNSGKIEMEKTNSTNNTQAEPPNKIKENTREKNEREKIVLKLQEFLENTQLNKNKGYIMPLFKRVNPNMKQISVTEVFDKAPYADLVKYYEVLQPVSNLKVIADHYHISLEKVMDYCRILIPTQPFEKFSECFQVITKEHTQQIISMIEGDIDNGILKTA